MEVKLHKHEKVNLLNFDRLGLQSYFSEIGEKPFRATQLLKWIYQFGVDDFNTMSNLSKSLREKLNEVAEIKLPEIVTEQHSDDGTIANRPPGREVEKRKEKEENHGNEDWY